MQWQPVYGGTYTVKYSTLMMTISTKTKRGRKKKQIKVDFVIRGTALEIQRFILIMPTLLVIQRYNAQRKVSSCCIYQN